MDTKSYANLFRFYRYLQGASHYCNFILLIGGLLLAIVSALELVSYATSLDSSLIVRGGYLSAGSGSFLMSIIGSGAELKSNQAGLMLASFIGVFVITILPLAFYIESREFDKISLIIDPTIETVFREFEISIKKKQNVQLESKIVLTCHYYQCCGWYSPLEFKRISEQTYPDACCPQPNNQIVYSWDRNCTDKNRFIDPCYKKCYQIFDSDLKTMKSLAVTLFPFTIFNTLVIFTLSGFTYEMTA